MATAYTTEAALTSELGIRRLTTLLDRDDDGDADAGVLDATINDAGALIDARLARRYGVPFTAISLAPYTPDIIQLIAKYLTAHLLYKRWEPNGDDQAYYWRLADSMLNDILAGRTSIPGGTEVESEEQFRSVIYSASKPTIAGNDDDDVTATKRSYGM